MFLSQLFTFLDVRLYGRHCWLKNSAICLSESILAFMEETCGNIQKGWAIIKVFIKVIYKKKGHLLIFWTVFPGLGNKNLPQKHWLCHFWFIVNSWLPAQNLKKVKESLLTKLVKDIQRDNEETIPSRVKWKSNNSINYWRLRSHNFQK